jgi:hypothetical protein
MKTIKGKKGFKKYCPLPNCVTNRWELKPFFDESYENSTSYIQAEVFAYEQIVKYY